MFGSSPLSMTYGRVREINKKGRGGKSRFGRGRRDGGRGDRGGGRGGRSKFGRGRRDGGRGDRGWGKHKFGIGGKYIPLSSFMSPYPRSLSGSPWI